MEIQIQQFGNPKTTQPNAIKNIQLRIIEKQKDKHISVGLHFSLHDKILNILHWLSAYNWFALKMFNF